MLNEILGKFYVEVRRADGQLYKNSSFLVLRFAMQRKMKEIRGHDLKNLICLLWFKTVRMLFLIHAPSILKRNRCIFTTD